MNGKTLSSAILNRLEQAAKDEVYPAPDIFFVRHFGKTVRMVYPNPAVPARAKRALQANRVSGADGYSATFIQWKTDFGRYLPPECVPQNGVWAYADERVRMKVTEEVFFCADYEHSVYYYCLSSRSASPSHAMVIPYYLWGLQNGFLEVHAAAVGTDGKGVLLVADSGGGKSTLAATCLLHGMDFVSDDTTLLTGSGSLEALPIFSRLTLTPHSCTMLNPPYPVYWINPLNEDKRFMSIVEDKHFRERIPVNALVAPKLTAGKTKITAIDAGALLEQFYQSSLKLTLADEHQEYRECFFRRLEKLKAYRLELGSDVHANADFLRDFIRREIEA